MAARKQLSFWSLLPRKVKRQHWPGCFNINVETRHNPHTTPAPAHQSQLTQLVSGNFIIQLTDTTGDAGSTFSAPLYGHRACVASLCWPKATPDTGQLAPTIAFVSTSTKKKLPSANWWQSSSASSLQLIETHCLRWNYIIVCHCQCHCHRIQIKYSIKQANAQKQQWNLVSFYQSFCHRQSPPSVRISQAP